MGILSGLFGKQSKVNAPPTPEYYTDPNFTSTQDFLKKYSENILSGNIPEFYKSIGMTSDQASGAGLMNDYVSQATKDIIGRDLEAGALTGRGRTGLSSNALSQAGLQGGVLRYQDYLRAMEGKKYLMEQGLAGETGVRSAATADMAERNPFNQWKYSADLAQEKARAAQANAFSAQRWGAADDILGMALAPATGGLSMANTSYGAGGMSFDINDLLKQILGAGKKKSAIGGQVEGIASPDFGAITMKAGLPALGF